MPKKTKIQLPRVHKKQKYSYKECLKTKIPVSRRPNNKDSAINKT